MDFRRFAPSASKLVPIALALILLIVSVSHRDRGVGQTRAEAAEQAHRLHLRRSTTREEYLASRHGFQFGVPAQAFANAKAQTRALAAKHSGGHSAAVALPADTPHWNAIGPQPMTQAANFTGIAIGSAVQMTGRVTAIAADAHNAIVVGTAAGGLWVSTDNGTTFASAFDNQPTESIGAIALDTTTTPSTIYVGTGEGNNSIDSLYGAGLFRSTDLGQSWAQLAAGTFGRGSFTSLAIDTTTTPPHLFAGITSGFSGSRADAGLYETDSKEAGLWRSTDGGATWPLHYAESIFNDCDVLGGSDAPCAADDVKIDPVNPQNVYTAIDTDTVYISNDGGTNFHPAMLGLPADTFQGRHSLAIGPKFSSGSPGGEVFAMVGAFDTNEYINLYVSVDAGATWNGTGAGFPPTPTVPSFTVGGVTLDGTGPANIANSFYNQALLVPLSNDPSTVYFGGVGLYLSAGASGFGHSWTFLPTNGEIHPNVHALTLNPTDNQILVGTDGGLFKFNPNQGATPTFVSLNQTINAGLIQGIGVHPTDPTKVLAGFQSNGTQVYGGSSSSWAAPNSETGDGGFAFYDAKDPMFLYHGFSLDQVNLNGQLISASPDGGATWCSQPNAAVPACNVGDGEWSTNLVDILSDPITGDPGGPVFYPPIAVDPNNAHRVFFGAHWIYVSTDGMAHWTQQTNIEPDLTSKGGFAKGVVDCNGVTNAGSCPCPDGSCAIEDIEFVPSDPTRAWALAMSSLDGSVAFALSKTLQADKDINSNPPHGASWSDVTQALDTTMKKTSPFGALATQATSIATDPINRDTAYIAFSGFTFDPSVGTSVGHLYKTMNFGTSWTLADGNTISGSTILLGSSPLPDVPVLKVIVDRLDASGSCGGNPCSNSIYAGTDVGVFHSTDGGGTWQSMNTGLPDVPVYDLAQNKLGSVFAGTHGRGAFQLIAATTIPSPTATATATATGVATATRTATATATPTATRTATATATRSATATRTATATATATSGATATATATGAATATATVTPTATATGTIGATPTATATPAPTGAKMSAPRAAVLPAVGIGTGALAQRSFLIRNIGRTGNLIGGVAIDPLSVIPPASTFAITTGTSFNLAPRGVATVTITLSPQATSNTANAIITSNDPAHLSQTIAIRGTAFAGRASIPATVTIRAPVGQPTTAALKITNVGRGALSGSWSDVTTPPFSVTAGVFGPLQPHAAATITIGFTAAAKGAVKPAGSLPITVNPLSTGGRTVSLRGVGR